MAEDQGQRKDLWQTAPWLKLFGAFKVALDPKKLLLAGAGILVMSVGWWVLGWFFGLFHGSPPPWESTSKDPVVLDQEWKSLKQRRARYNLFHQMAGTAPQAMDAVDLSQTYAEYTQLTQVEEALRKGVRPGAPVDVIAKAELLINHQTLSKPYGRLTTLPWFEYRGPNPYLLVSGRIMGPGGTEAHPWAQGEFLGWLLRDESRVVLEPLFKFLQPIVYLFRPGSGGLNLIFLLLVILWMLVTWGFFGGAITRMAVVQVARTNEKVGMMDALRFARSRFQSFFSAPLFPLIFIGVITIFLVLFGFAEGLTWIFGDIIVAGLFWPLVLIGGLVMAVVLVGLVGWPLMYATISAEGSDSFDALSRSYSYVYQAPWHYIWCSLVALVYGAALVFFVGFMGSLLVYMGKWGVTRAWYVENREPTYLFQYAPTSFGWRDLLLRGSPHVRTHAETLPSGVVVGAYELDPDSTYTQTISWNNRVGAFLVAIWLGLVFLLIVGFGYSYFWTAATIIYLLMRRKVDDTELDEIHLEEEEEEPFAPEPAAAPASVPEVSKPVMVEAPTLRTPVPATEVTVGAPAPPPPPPAAEPAPLPPLETPPPVPPPIDGPAPGGQNPLP